MCLNPCYLLAGLKSPPSQDIFDLLLHLSPMCTASGQTLEQSHAFTEAWPTYVEQQKFFPAECQRRFITRYEHQSLWETLEVQNANRLPVTNMEEQ